MTVNHTKEDTKREETGKRSLLVTYLYHIIALAIVAVWGSTLVSTKILIQSGLRPDEIFILRFLLAYIAILFISPRKLWADNLRDELMMVLLGITGGSAYFITENMAVGLTYVNNVSFIASVSPLVTMAIALCTYKGITIRRVLFVGSAFAVLGIAIVVFNGQLVLHLNPLGDLLAVATMVCFGVYCYFLKQMGEKYNPVFLTRKMFAYGLLTALPLLAFCPWQFPLAGLLEPKMLLNLLFLGIVASFGCFVMWSVCINRVGAVTCSNYLYLIPLATVFFSAIFLNEQMTLIAWIGCACILLGVYLANLGCRD